MATVESRIEDKIRSSLEPVHLEVVNESHMHSVPPGSESHFKLVVVSPAFEGLTLVQRHQRINGILADELKTELHALSMETLTAGEWDARGGRTLESPACHGGSKADQ